MTAEPPATAVSPAFYVTGGTLPPNAPSYVERQADTDLFQSLLQGDLCYVLNARQMGKSSLCVRTIGRLREIGIQTVFLDLTRYGGKNLTPEQWYATLLSDTGRELGLRSEFLQFWKSHQELTPVRRYFSALREIALAHDRSNQGRIVIFVDEIDVTRSLSFSADEFFAAIRAAFVERATDPTWNDLTFCLLGTATPADLIEDTTITPFNVGKRIELRDFTVAEATPLAAGLGSSAGAGMLARVLHWTGGQPYMTQKVCEALRKRGGSGVQDVDVVVAELFLSRKARDADDNLANVRNRLLRGYDDLSSLLDLYDKVLAGKRIPDEESDPRCAILKLSGAVKEEGGTLKVRNAIYATVFNRAWVQSSLPDAELRRQGEAYRRGVVRALGLSGAVLAVVVGLTLYAFQQAHTANAALVEARQQRDRAERISYISAINLAQRDYENNNVGHTLDLLEETKHNPNRGFEWGYLYRLCHLDLLTLKGHTSYVTSVAFSPNGKRLLTGSFDHTAKMWDAATGKETLTLKGHTGQVFSVAFSPDGKRLLTGSYDKTAKVWDAATGKETLTLKGHADSVSSVAFSPDGKRLLTGSFDKTAKLWDSATGKEMLTLNGHTGSVSSVAFSPDGKRLLTGSFDKTAKVWFSE